jgi:sulfur-oxidizing protein SoxZ
MSMAQARTLITVPAQAKKGEFVQVRALIQHPMENGFRHDENGRRIARDMIQSFRCSFNGKEVFRADLQGGIAANPLMQVTLLAQESGTLEFLWEGDNNFRAQAKAQLLVT